ncbi:MAG: hypothetical protein JXJ17_18690 [Anaerolineae bacterium]|nr:hypothetical protein [Anaerolineae bacterium]
MADPTIAQNNPQLSDFDAGTRSRALDDLIGQPDSQPVTPSRTVNMHCHSFYSFNGYGCSPTALAWQGKLLDLDVMGIVDFDVLDGVDEFLDACDRVRLRASAGIETRVFIPEFATREINSPGEPGVCYHMGIGFTTGRVPDRAAAILDDLRQRSDARNRAMVERINAYLQPVTASYEDDILPLTPNNNATERHMLAAYVSAAEKTYPDEAECAQFWAEKLGIDGAAAQKGLNDVESFKDVIRSKLMKRGGVGYSQPGPDTFPTLDEVNDLIILSGALPCFAWLDGTSAGEQDIEELLELMIEKGAAAVNIIPDRNWNIGDPDKKRIKVDNLYRFVQLAADLDLPVNAGTEVNKYGQRLVDDFDAPEMAPLRDAFLDGAHFIYGHTLMQRWLAMGYQSEWAKVHLPTRREKNAFYTRVGYQVPPGEAGRAMMSKVNAAMSPADIIDRL